MNKKIIKTASVIAVGAGAAALYKGKFAKDNDSDSGSCGCKNSNGKDADKKSMTDKVIENGVSMLMIVMERLKAKTEAMLQIIMKNLTIRTRSVENTIRTAKAFTMQAATTKHLQDLKSRSVSRKNRHTSWEVVLVHLLQPAFL